MLRKMSTCQHLTLLFYVLVASHIVQCTQYVITISNDGPVILGAEITFKAEILNTPKGLLFDYSWLDDAVPHHSYKVTSNNTKLSWTVSYNRSQYLPGAYAVRLDAYYCLYWFQCYTISNKTTFQITSLLNGHLDLLQNGTAIMGSYISTLQPTVHNVSLSVRDLVNATSILTYWFIDCNYYGMTQNDTFMHEYTMENEVHNIDALVVVSYDPIPSPTTPAPLTTTTTTPMPTTTTIIPTPTSIEASTTQSFSRVMSSSSALTGAVMVKREAWEVTSKGPNLSFDYSTTPFIPTPPPFGPTPMSYSCLNNSILVQDPKKTYGVFHRKIIVQVPVQNLTLYSARPWVQRGDMMNVQMSCSGTPPFYYCIQYKLGTYIPSGNETCASPVTIMQCDVPILHLFSNVDSITVVAIATNNLGKSVKSISITFYHVNTKAQLSVIVVPVAFSIVAVILIIFGLAYYIQSRSRFTVEVADFNFGQQYADLEYKTFVERLRDSFNSAISWGGMRNEPAPSTWGPDNNKYGTMT